MKRIHIFKPGTHTSAGGTTIEFGEDVLRAAVEAYDPELHQAPIVVGHPADNGPAYGWINKLDYAEGEGIYAEPAEVEEQFSELVQQGRFKKVSASFYSPEAPTNPKPGTYYLRHLGFLGAQPPAIKGLKPIEFSEAEEGVIEGAIDFNELQLMAAQGVFKRLREWLIDRFSRQEADSVIPEWALEELGLVNRTGVADIDNATPPTPGQNPQQPTQQEDPAMDLQQQLDALKKENELLKNQQSSFSERETALNKREAELTRADLTRSIQALADEGKVLPADVAPLAEFAANLDAEEVVEFGEGDEAKASRRDFLLAYLAKQPKRVDFNEHSGDGDEPTVPLNPAEKAARITNYRERMEAKGQSVTYDQALRVVNSGKDLED